jgi:hypothetical protein
MTIKIKYPSIRKRIFLLKRVCVRPIDEQEIPEWNRIVQEYHPLGAPKLPGHQIRYVAEHCGKAVALLSFSACAYHLAARDQWIGWTREQRLRRKNFIAQNSRFLVLPGEKNPNLASKVLGLCIKRLPDDWKQQFSYKPVLVETFVDKRRFRGSCYLGAGWEKVGTTRGFRRDARDFYVNDSSPKSILMKELCPGARKILCSEELPEELRKFETGMPQRVVFESVGAKRMRTLFSVLQSIKDPRVNKGKRYSLGGCLAIVACGVLAGCTSMRACAELASSLSQSQRRMLRLWRNKNSGKYDTPNQATLWRTVKGVDANEFERKINEWLRSEDALPGAIAIDGKVLKATLDNEESGSCVVSAVSHSEYNADSFFLNTLSPTESARKQKARKD